MTHFSSIAVYTARDSVKGRGNLFVGPGALRLASRPNAVARVARFNVGNIAVGEVTSSGHDVEVSEPLGATLVVPLRGRLTTETAGVTLSAGSREGLLFSPNQRRTRVEAESEGHFLGIPLIVPNAEIESAAERLGASRPDRRRLSSYALPMSEATGGEARELIELARVLYGEVARGSPRLSRVDNHLAWNDLLSEKIVEVLHAAEVITLPDCDAFSGLMRRNAGRALDYMQAHFADIETIADVARECGIGIRALEQAFKKTWGLPPNRALAEIRLNEARKSLVHAEETLSITEIAMACGFRHLGRFAAAYRQRFGESPSDTRARR